MAIAVEDGRGEGWRRRVREYGAALMLTMALFSAPPDGRLSRRPAVVRLVHRRRRGNFDPRELAGRDLVLTLPVVLDDGQPPRLTNLN